MDSASRRSPRRVARRGWLFSRCSADGRLASSDLSLPASVGVHRRRDFGPVRSHARARLALRAACQCAEPVVITPFQSYGPILPIAAGLFGLAIGSFLNVLVHRLPRGESIVTPPSHCPSCGTPV